MQIIRNFFFPALMIVGIVLSAFVIVTTLQAAASPVPTRATIQTASIPNQNDLAAQGRALFLAKGCIVCHRHDALAAFHAQEFQFDGVPNLTKLKISEDYLRRWLHDPIALKPSTAMPNLELSETEIDALVAFLTTQSK